jgi:choice-of-anchor C domain-containing protein
MNRAIFSAFAVSLVAGAHANLLQNGSFELNADGLVNPGKPFITLNGGSTFINNWVVTGDSVDYINQYWPAEDGNWSLDLSGNAPGGVSQTIDNLKAGVYSLSFFIAGNPAGAPGTKQMAISWGTGGETFDFNTQNSTLTDMKWHETGTMFEWAGGNLTLTFATDTSKAGQNTAYGPALDNVKLTALPAPPAALPMLLGGLGLIRRRWKLRRGLVSPPAG